MKNSQFDIIILGAGPAGSTAALSLKDSGYSIALIDKAVFPRDKICGDAVSPIAKRILRQIDPDYETDLIDNISKTNISKARLYSPRFEPLEIEFRNVGHCIRRIDFDNWLFNKTKANRNITYMLGALPTAVNTGENGITLSLNTGETITGKILLGCDGAQSFAAKKLAHFTVDRKHYSAAIRQYYRNVDGLSENSIEVYLLKGYLPGYFWIFPLRNNIANVGFGMLSETIAQNKINLKQDMDAIIRSIPEIAVRFRNAEALEQSQGFVLPLGSKKYPISGERFMLCGDAASLIDPFSGEGIETAMESGKFAAEQAIQCFQQNRFDATFLMQYDKRVYKKMWGNFYLHYKLQQLLGARVWLINGLFKLCNIPWINKRIPKYFY